MTGQRFAYLNQWDSPYVLRALSAYRDNPSALCQRWQHCLWLVCFPRASGATWDERSGCYQVLLSQGRTLWTCSVLHMCVTVWPLGTTPGCLIPQLSLEILSLSLFPQALLSVLANCCFHRLSTRSNSHTLTKIPWRSPSIGDRHKA